MLNSHRPTFLALVAALTASLTANAAEWVAEPSVSLREQYDDNYRLTAVDQDAVWETTLDPRLRLSRRSDLWDMSATGRLRASRFTGQDGLDTIDNFFDVAAERPFERGSFNAKASLVNDTTLQNEELDFDTGVTVRQIDRMRSSLGLGGNYMLNETNWIEPSLDYAMVTYDALPLDRFYDYDTLTPSLRIVHQYNQQTQVFGTLSHSETNYDDLTDTQSKTDSLQLGVAYDITETWKVKASAGRQRTNTTLLVPTAIPRPGLEFLFPFVYDIAVLTRESESSGLVYDASITRKFETGSLSLSASQSSDPSSRGVSQESTRINLDGDLIFNAKLTAKLAVSYNQSSTLGGGAIGSARSQDIDRYLIAPSITWRLDEELTLNTGYVYRRTEKSTAINDTADSNAVFVSLGYSWPRMSMSR